MVFEFKFPDVGEGIHEGKLVKWLVKEGDEIKADQPVVEVETDKAVVELPTPQGGILLKMYFKEGDVVHVGDVAFAVGEKGEVAREIAKQVAAPEKAPIAQKPQPSQITDVVFAQTPAAQAGSRPAAPEVYAPVSTAPAVQAPVASAASASAPQAGGKALATPATRKYAADTGVDIEKVQGTGPGGRVTIEDVKAFSSSKGGAGGIAHVAEGVDDFGPVERVKISGLRKAIAEKMVKSAYTIPHVTHMDEVDVTWLVQVRERAKQDAAAKGVKLTYLPFIIKAVIAALKEFPQFNARYDAESQELVMRKYYNIGIATDTDDGLLVPVIKNADSKDLLTLAMEIGTAAEEARKRRLKLEEMRGGTFTITNIGSTGGVWATPIINYPEVAILGVMKIKERPAVVEGRIEAKKMMTLVLSFDHRVIDGAVAARFMNAIVKRLEDPTLL